MKSFKPKHYYRCIYPTIHSEQLAFEQIGNLLAIGIDKMKVESQKVILLSKRRK